MDTPIGGRPNARYAAGQAPVDASVNLLGLADTLIRRRWVILIVTVLFAGLGLLALSMIAPRFTATTRIFIDPREQRAIENEVVQQGFGSDMALVDSQVEVITSEAVLKRVVQNTGLASDAEFSPPGTGGHDPAVTALEALARAVNVTRPENTYVLQISVTSKEAAKSARLANAVATAYLGYQADTTAGTARDISSSIRNRLLELQTELNKAEEEVEAFKREHNVSQSEGQLLGDRRLTDLAARQSAAVARVNETKTRFEVMQDALKTRGDISTVVTGTASAMVSLRTQLAEARRSLAELQRVLGPRHPRVIAASAEVAQAQATIRAESEQLVRAAQDDYRAAVDTLNQVNADLELAKTAAFETNQDLIKLRELERKAQSSKVVYEAFLVRAKETAEQENISAPNARIIADAAVPSSPSYPPRTPLLAAAVLLGLFLGVLAAILWDLAAGMLAARSPARIAPAPEPASAGGLVMVVAADDPALARQAALEMAGGAHAADRRVIFLDLAHDAPSDSAGFAELATGRVPAAKAVRIDGELGIQTLNAGQPDAIAALSRDQAAIVLRAIMLGYDDIVVNAGALEAGSSILTDAASGYSRETFLAVRDGVLGPRERQAMATLSAGGDRTVSAVSVEAGEGLTEAA